MNKYCLQLCSLLLIVMLGVTSTFAQDSTCPDAPEPRLVIGAEGEVTPGSANNVRLTPTTTAELVFRMEAGSHFMVLAGPRCADGYNWWQVFRNGQSGWTVEGNSDGYFLAPIVADTATATATSPANDECSVVPRLILEEWGRITSSTPSRLRSTPGVAGVRIGQIDPLETFRIVEGPICLDGINWWKVVVNNTAVEGWTAEGTEGEYFLELVPLVPTPTPAFLPLPPTYALDWSGDGTYIAVGTAEGIFIFDTRDMELPPVQLLSEYRAISLVFNPIIPNLLAVSASRTEDIGLRIIDVETGEVVWGLSRGFLGYYRGFVSTEDGTKLAVDASASLSVYDFQTGTSLYDVRPRDYGDGSVEFRGFAEIAMSPDGEWIGGSYPGGESTFVFVGAFGAAQEDLVVIESVSIPEHITSMTFSPESDRFVISGENGNLRMWTVPDYGYASFIRGERSTTSNRVNAVAFSPTEPILITAESDPLAVVRVFDAQTLAQRQATVLEDTVGGARDLAFSPDGMQLAVLVDDIVMILDTTTFETIQRLVLQPN